MADWKTYAKAARNTARKQAPEVKRSAQDSARRGSQRAGDYVRAAGRVVEESRREDRARPADEHQTEGAPRPERARRPDEEGPREYDPRPEEAPRSEQEPRADRSQRSEQSHRPEQSRQSEQARRPSVDTDRLRRDAAAYYTVAERRVRGAQLGPRIMRAVRDALLIGLSLFAIWVVLAAAGLQIPFSAVLIAVGVIVLISFGTSLYASTKRARGRAAADETDDADDS